MKTTNREKFLAVQNLRQQGLSKEDACKKIGISIANYGYYQKMTREKAMHTKTKNPEVIVYESKPLKIKQTKQVESFVNVAVFKINTKNLNEFLGSL